MNRIIIIILLALCINVIKAQGTPEWIKYYNDTNTANNNNYNISKVIAADEFNYVYVSGYCVAKHPVYDGVKMVTVKYSPNGDLLWKTSFPQYYSFGFTSPYSIELDGDGNIYLAGAYRISQNTDYLIVKYDNNGQLKWSKSFNGPFDYIDAAYDVEVDAAGNVYVTGKCFVSVNNSYDILTIKYNSQGNQLWSVYYNGTDSKDDIGSAVKIDSQGNIYVAGTSGNSENSKDFCIIKYNSSGIKQWDYLYHYGYDVLSDMRIDASGFVYVMGMSTVNNKDLFVTAKYSDIGSMKWQRFFDGKDTSHLRNIPYSMDMDKDGFIYVTGSTEKNWDTADYATIKYNSDGIEQWRRFYNSPDKRFDMATGIKADWYGNCYVTGLTKKINGDFGITTVKYLSNGIQKWHNTIDGAVDVLQEEYPFIAVNPMGDIYTSGTVFGAFNRLEFMTVKYKHENDTVIIEPVLPEVYELKQNYPNPFNPETNIMFDLPEAAEVSIKIYNMNGRLVETFLEGFMEGGRRVLKWNAAKYSSGIYFCRMDAGNYIQYMKMVYVK